MAFCPVRFEIEYVNKEYRYVVARLLDSDSNFSLTENTTLGGVAIQSTLTMPRSTDKHGNPRLDLFVFRLRRRDDAGELAEGQMVELLT